MSTRRDARAGVRRQEAEAETYPKGNSLVTVETPICVETYLGNINRNSYILDCALCKYMYTMCACNMYGFVVRFVVSAVVVFSPDYWFVVRFVVVGARVCDVV